MPQRAGYISLTKITDYRELKLYRRKKASVLNSIHKNVFATIDGYRRDLATANAIADVAAAVAIELHGLKKDIDSIANELKNMRTKFTNSLSMMPNSIKLWMKTLY